jgi:hypothetical protein
MDFRRGGVVIPLVAGRFLAAVDDVLGGRKWRYGPWAPDADPPSADCSTFAAAVLQSIYGGRPGDDLWAAVNVYAASRPWSGPEYLEAAGHVAGIAPGAEAVFVQQWDWVFSRGHAFFAVRELDKWRRVEAARAGVGPSGVWDPSSGRDLYRIVTLTTKDVPVSSLSVPPEVRDEAEDAIEIASQVAISAVVDALADGKIEPDEAKAQIARVVESVIDGLGDVLDALLVLPEPLESLSDMAIAAAAGEAKKAVGPALGQIGDVVRDVLHRDADELEARADRIEARNPKRAEKLRKKAASLR